MRISQVSLLNSQIIWSPYSDNYYETHCIPAFRNQYSNDTERNVHNYPTEWPDLGHPDCAPCPHHQQSPVDVTPDLMKDLSAGLVTTENYDQNVSLVAVNTGRGREFDLLHKTVNGQFNRSNRGSKNGDTAIHRGTLCKWL